MQLKVISVLSSHLNTQQNHSRYILCKYQFKDSLYQKKKQKDVAWIDREVRGRMELSHVQSASWILEMTGVYFRVLLRYYKVLGLGGKSWFSCMSSIKKYSCTSVILLLSIQLNHANINSMLLGEFCINASYYFFFCIKCFLYWHQ